MSIRGACWVLASVGDTGRKRQVEATVFVSGLRCAAWMLAGVSVWEASVDLPSALRSSGLCLFTQVPFQALCTYAITNQVPI